MKRLIKKLNNPSIKSGSIYKGLLKLSLPIIVSNLLHTLYHLADTFWIGKLGEKAVSTLTVIHPVIFLPFAISLGLSVGNISFVSQFIGAGRQDEAEHSSGQSLLIFISLGILTCVTGWFLAPIILKLLGTGEEIYAQTLSYLRIMLIGVVFNYLYMHYRSTMQAFGDTISPLKVQFTTITINIILDPLIIFGYLGFPKMGIDGAALATIFSQAIAGFYGLGNLFFANHEFKLRRKCLVPDFSKMMKMIKIAAPSSMSHVITSLGFVGVMRIVTVFDYSVIATYGIVNRIIMFFMLPAMGIGQAVSTFVGQNLGNSNVPRAKKAINIGTVYTLLILFVATTLTFFFGDFVIKFFIPGNEAIAEMGKTAFMIISYPTIFFALLYIINGAFNGAGYTLPVLIINTLRLWAFRIPFSYVLSIPLAMNEIGIWYSIALSNLLSLAIAYIWYKKGNWAKAVV